MTKCTIFDQRNVFKNLTVKNVAFKCSPVLKTFKKSYIIKYSSKRIMFKKVTPP